MKNRPFSVVFLGAVVVALLVQFGLEAHSILLLPAEDRAGPFWQFRDRVVWEIAPYVPLGVLVPFVRLPPVSRWFLVLGLAIVGGTGVFVLSGLGVGGGDMRGLAGIACFQMQAA